VSVRETAWLVESHKPTAPAGSAPERVQVAAVVGADVPTVRVARDGRPFCDLSVVGAEGEAVALLMAAAAARGEQGLTAALNRVVVALGSPEPVARPDAGRMVEQMRNALHMADDAPWGLLVDTASRLRGEVEAAREAQVDADKVREMLGLDEGEALAPGVRQARADIVRLERMLRGGRLRARLSPKRELERAERVPAMREAGDGGHDAD